MPILSNSKHERFAQNVTKGLSATKAYVSAGYSKAGAEQNASRLMTKDDVLARIKELQTIVSERVVACEVRRRSWRVQVLQDRIEAMLALSQARAVMYAGEMGGSYQFQVQTKGEERAAIAEGCRVLPVDVPPTPAPTGDGKDPVQPAPPSPPEYPKTMLHAGYSVGGATQTKGEERAAIAEGCRVLPVDVPPTGDGKDPVQPAPPSPPEYPKTMLHAGYSVGGATGLLMKEFRGKNGEQVIWMFDAALEARIADNLKQAAIEEGQWTEKRETAREDTAAIVIANLHAGRQRVVDAKAKALANGEPWLE
jgi:hypothetical protein